MILNWFSPIQKLKFIKLIYNLRFDDMFHTKLKGKDRLETIENYCILFIFVGAAILSLGIGLTIITPKGIPVILSMFGALLSFLSTIALVFTWVAKDFSEPGQ